MGIEHAVDLGPDRVIADLSVEPSHVQQKFRELFAVTAVALGDEDETAESYFRRQS
ncbi:MAG: hypothetical protein ACFCVK_23025 [Acidimicrobiales bacterium]